MEYFVQTLPVDPDKITIVKKDGEEVTFIPAVEDNSDYQKYLEWVAEGNTAPPYDPGV